MKSQKPTDSDSEIEAERAEGLSGGGPQERGTMGMAGKTPLWKRLSADEAILSSLIILSVIGAGISQASVSAGGTYWLAMVPIIAAATVYIEGSKVGAKGIKWLTLIRTQAYHWGSFLVAVELMSLFSHLGRISNESVSLVILLLVAQTTFLVGVYTDWRFAVVALFQVFSIVILTYLAAYLWIMLIVAIGIIALGIYFQRKSPEKELSPLRQKKLSSLRR